MVNSTVVSVTLGALAVALGFSAAPGQAPASPAPSGPPPSAEVRNVTGLTYLHALTPGSLSEGLVGYRLSRAWGVTPGVAFEASLLRVGGESVILQGGGAGVRWTRQAGPFRFRPAAELVAGRGIVDEGGWTYETAGGERVYRPFRRPSSTPAVGAGVLGSVEWLSGWGIGAELAVGYWHLALPRSGGAFMVGGGLRGGARDAEWWWRTSGRDDVPPRFAVVSPSPSPNGDRAIDAAGLRVEAADRSGIREIRVDGVPADLQRASPRAGDAEAASAPAVTATAVPPIHGGRHPLRIEVVDGAGNVGEAEVWVTGSTAPALTATVTGPEPGTAVKRPWADVVGFVQAASPEVRVRVGPCAVKTEAGVLVDAPARVFRLRVPVAPGPQTFDVTIADPMAGGAVLHHTVRRVDDGPVPPGAGFPTALADAAPSVSGLARRVWGTVRQAAPGVAEVVVNGAPTAVELSTPTRSTIGFMTYLPSREAEPVEVVARSFDGRSVRAEAVSVARPGPAPRAAGLFVGIERYEDGRIEGPAGAAGSARALAERLGTHGAPALAPERVRVLTDGEATGPALRAALRWLADAAEDADVVFVYLAARGVATATRQAGGLVPHGIRATYGPGSVSWRELEDRLAGLPAEVVVLTDLVDDSGGALPPPLRAACGPDPLPAGGLAVVSASAAGDGSFSRRALEVLSPAEPGTADGTVRLSDLIRELEEVGGALRTPATYFDPALPLVGAPARGGAR